nr:acyltransferase [uncultured Capnocytophaga sp.]
MRFITLLYKYRFKSFGKKSYLHSPLKIDGIENIEIGNGVSIAYKTWLAAVPLTGEKSKLIIEDGVNIGNFNHIYATQSIIIRKNVLTADKIYISDNLHGYENIYTPIIKQPIVQKKEVEIGEGSWLGENVCIIGASIGKHCVVGANSVVTKDFPDYCVIVGAPAKIIKRYCFEQQKWRKTDNNGNFID